MKIFITLVFILTASTSFTQNLIQTFDGINFNINGNISPAPFNGGMNNARTQFVDIDGDNDLDLFTFDADTSLYFYENTGSAQNAEYRLVSRRFQDLNFKNWFYFADMDNDTDPDLFTGGEFQTIKYFKNVGTANIPSYTLMIEELRTDTDTVIYSESNCVPVFCDIDADGDKDFFTGQSLGTVTYYENIGSSNNFSYKYITDFWQNLIIISPALIAANTRDNINSPFIKDTERHGSNALEFVDIDNDNDFDLFWGDLFSAGIYYIQNNGTPTNPNVVILDSIYPHNSSFLSLGYNATRFVDIDADGDKDMFVSVLYLAQNKNNFAYYRNDGNSVTPNFQRISDNYLNNVDVGGNSNITFTDIDNDGDNDLFIGNDYAKISYFKNTGSSVSPSFNLETDSLPILSEGFNYAPAFADLDNDGDDDMLVGSYIRDSLWFYRNTGSPNNFNFTLEARGHQIGIGTLGQSSTPSFVDIDNDQDFDLFLGGTNGRIIYYENTGTPNNFNFVYITNFYSSIDAGDESIPRFFDLDTDGDFDLFIGKQNGTISYYRNEGNAGSPNFVLQTNNFKEISVHSNACPEFNDIDNDTDPDLFIGNVKGGLFYFKNDDVSGIQTLSNESPETFTLHQNYPNPFNPSTKIKFDLKNPAIVKLTVYDISGKEVEILVNEKMNTGTYEFTWNAEALSSGVYFYKLSVDNFSLNKSMLYIK